MADDDEEEMARLRKSKKHQAFEKKFDRRGARMMKQIHLQQQNESLSPQALSKESICVDFQQLCKNMLRLMLIA